MTVTHLQWEPSAHTGTPDWGDLLRPWARGTGATTARGSPQPFLWSVPYWYLLVSWHIFFGNRIEKDGDSITHHHLMTALSKTASCCPARLGAGSPPPRLACLDTFSFTSHSESPAFPQVEAGCSHQAGGLPYLGHPSGTKAPAGWAGAEWAPSSAPAKAGEEGGEAGSGLSTLVDLLLSISPTRGMLAPAAACEQAHSDGEVSLPSVGVRFPHAALK